MFSAIDRFILDKFVTPLAHGIERNARMTNFFLAWWAFGSFLIFMGVMMGMSIYAEHAFGLFTILGILMLAFLISGIVPVMGQFLRADARIMSKRENAGEMPRVANTSTVFVRMILIVKNGLDVYKALTHGTFETLFSSSKSQQEILAMLAFMCLTAGMYLRLVQRPSSKSLEPKGPPLSDLSPT